jgi:hypothetical protein
MTRRGLACLLCWSAAVTRGEVLDRVAVSLGTSVITLQDLKDHLRVRAFLESTPVKADSDALRDAADKLIQQLLIRREMESSRYAPPDAALVEQLVQSFKQARFGGDEAAYEAGLQAAGLKDAQIREWFRWTLTVLRFVEFRFRPGVQIPAEEIREYYETQFVPQWRRRTSDPPPTYEQAERACEEILMQERIDNLLDRWISQTRTQVNIKYQDEAFRR